MREIVAKGRLSVRMTEGRGRGVFAAEAIPEGELVERCPVIVFAEGSRPEFQPGNILHTYFFNWGADGLAIALGFGSLYNHSPAPNARHDLFIKEHLIEFRATRQIEQDEEICIQYRSDGGPLWFEVL